MYLHASHVDTFSFGVRSLNSLQTSSREIPVCCVVGSRNKHVLRFILVAATVSRNLSKPVPGLVFISRGAAYIPHGRTTSLPFCDKPVAGKRPPALLAESWNVYLVSSPVKSPWQCAHRYYLPPRQKSLRYCFWQQNLKSAPTTRQTNTQKSPYCTLSLVE